MTAAASLRAIPEASTIVLMNAANAAEPAACPLGNEGSVGAKHSAWTPGMHAYGRTRPTSALSTNTSVVVKSKVPINQAATRRVR